MGVRVVFESTKRDDVQTEMECFANSHNEIYLIIDNEGFMPSHICLDKSTAIKFSKTLRTEISKLK